MFNINDFILYMPMNNNTLDYSLYGHVAVETSITKTPNELGVVNAAYLFNADTDRIDLPALVGNLYATFSNSGASTLYFNLRPEVHIDNQVYRLFSQYGNAGKRMISYTLSRLSQYPDYSFIRRYSEDATNTNGSESGANAFIPSQWRRMKLVVKNNGATNTDYAYRNGTLIHSAASNNLLYETSPLLFQVGRQSNEGNTNPGFQGSINNIMIMKRELDVMEEKFVEKFNNLKRIAA